MTPLTCDQLNDLLGDILDDAVELHVRAEVEIHLGVCPHCGGLVAACRATITVTRALPKCDPLPADLEARLRKRCGGDSLASHDREGASSSD